MLYVVHILLDIKLIHLLLLNHYILTKTFNEKIRIILVKKLGDGRKMGKIARFFVMFLELLEH